LEGTQAQQRNRKEALMRSLKSMSVNGQADMALPEDSPALVKAAFESRKEG